jgi:triacylglycerol esterase/lipase EstA (alpha/beta hydrolase family)
MGTRTSWIVVLVASLAGALGPGVAAPAQAQSLRAESPPPTIAAAGANDWSCKPTAAHPSPVVIVHGTFGDSKSLLDRLSWSMHRTGYCVFAVDYGNRATGPIENSAQQLKDFVSRVLTATGAAKVSMVGHSQGGMMPRYYIKFLGGADKVDDLVGLAPSNHGTSHPLLLTPGVEYFCPACLQQKTGSEFLRNLNADDETPGPVSYTNIVTRYDEVVLPYTSGYLAGDNTTNIELQAKCRFDLVGHVLIPMDGPAIRLVLNALGRSGPADPAYQPSCAP